jgi:hypothetical protein
MGGTMPLLLGLMMARAGSSTSGWEVTEVASFLQRVCGKCEQVCIDEGNSHTENAFFLPL